jgi:hypothetical protein
MVAGIATLIFGCERSTNDVKVGRDVGVQAEILSGVSESDKVIVNPPDSLVTGAIVRVASPSTSFGSQLTK